MTPTDKLIEQARLAVIGVIQGGNFGQVGDIIPSEAIAHAVLQPLLDKVVILEEGAEPKKDDMVDTVWFGLGFVVETPEDNNVNVALYDVNEGAFKSGYYFRKHVLKILQRSGLPVIYVEGK